MRFSVPTGSMGVASKEYITSVASKAERFGLVLHGRIMLRVMSHFSNIFHQFDILNVSVVPDFINKKWCFGVQMQRSAMLVRCMSDGVYWMLAFFSMMKSSISLDVSLYNLWSWGQYLRTLRYE